MKTNDFLSYEAPQVEVEQGFATSGGDAPIDFIPYA